MPKTGPEGFVVVVVQQVWCEAAAEPSSLWEPGAAAEGLGE